MVENITFPTYNWFKWWRNFHWSLSVLTLVTLLIILGKYPSKSEEFWNKNFFVLILSLRRRSPFRCTVTRGHHSGYNIDGFIRIVQLFSFAITRKNWRKRWRFSELVALWLVEISSTIWLVNVVCPRGIFDQSNGRAYFNQSETVSQGKMLSWWPTL